MSEEIENYTYCRRFSGMLKAICTADVKGQTSLTGLDETLLQFASFHGNTKNWKQMDSFCVLTRKLWNDQCWIAQYEEKIPEVFLEHYDAWMKKESKKRMRYEVRAGDYKGIYEIEGVERTSMPFDTDHISGMIIDVPIVDILGFLDELPPGANQSEELLRFIDAREKEGWEHLTEWQKDLLTPYLMRMIPEMPNYKNSSQEDVLKGVSVILEASKKKVLGWLENHGLDIDLKSLEKDVG
jgi:hypothetical protein